MDVVLSAIRPEYHNRRVLTSWWMPSHPEMEYPKEMVDWIDSINKGWQYRINYENYELYKLQAKQWLEDETNIEDYDNELDQEEWLKSEVRRCQENSLYFCNKYGKIIEAKADDGALHYIAWEAQMVLLFMFDSGYSYIIGKARQIGFTTTMCLAGMKRVNFTKSYFLKFITYSKDKGIEIFRDKVKWTYNRLPDHLAKEVKNWTDQVMSFEQKGDRKGREKAGQRFQVDAPSITAINGGSPAAVFVDEVGLFDIFGLMMSEARPALFKYNQETGKLSMQQQFIAWGTSGDMDKGGAEFESIFRGLIEEWRSRDFSGGIIPLFFNAYAKRGTDKAYLEREYKRVKDLKNTPNGDKLMVQYWQQYPITIDDMFIRKDRTLISRDYINKRLDEINSRQDYVEYGYYEPIFDKSQPTPDLYVPHKVVGATWVKSREGDANVSGVIIHHPPQGETWKNRWYQGTDPINSETGHSKMNSTVWDQYTNCPSAMIFDRQRDFKHTYLQCLLQGLYYDQLNNGGIPELIENNIGDMYLDFLEMHGFGKRVVANVALPEYLQIKGSKWFGVGKKSNTSRHLVTKLTEAIDGYGSQIDIPEFWNQLKTYVEKDLKIAVNSDGHRQTKFQAADLRYHYDDVIDGLTFAYVNAVSHVRKVPENIQATMSSKKVFKRYMCNAQTGYQKVLCDVNLKGEIVKINRIR